MFLFACFYLVSSLEIIIIFIITIIILIILIIIIIFFNDLYFPKFFFYFVVPPNLTNLARPKARQNPISSIVYVGVLSVDFLP